MSIYLGLSARNPIVTTTTLPMLPGLLSATRLLQMGCAETIVLRVLVTEVGLSVDEATTAIAAAQHAA
jgi:hypothetical protein